jgi:hypothetical protein
MHLRILILFLLPILLSPVSASSKKLSADLIKVKVYRQNAQLVHNTKVKLMPGENEITITGLATGLDAKSIQAKLSGRAVILGISSRVNYLVEQKKSPEINKLSDSLKKIQYAIKVEENKKSVLKMEENLIADNHKLGGTNTGINTKDLIAMANFYRSRLPELKAEMLRLQIEIEGLSEKERKNKRPD